MRKVIEEVIQQEFAISNNRTMELTGLDLSTQGYQIA